VLVLACNSRIWEAEAGGLYILGQRGLQSEALSKKKKAERKE
jgi:hypothetical protein